jgi:hypothetical protein
MKAILIILALSVCSCSPTIQSKQTRLKSKLEGKKPREEGNNLLPLYGIGLVGYLILNSLSKD